MNGAMNRTMNRTNDSRGVSAVLGVLMILAILASIITVIAVYRLPVLEKRAEFGHELKEIETFRSLESVYSGKDVSGSFELGAQPLPLVTVRMDSSLKVWRCDEITVRISYTGNNSSGSVTFRGELFGLNLSIYPSRLPYCTIAMTPFGLAAYQGGYWRMENTSQYFNSSVVEKGNVVSVYVDNYTVNGHAKNFTFSGTGFATLSTTVQGKRAFSVNATTANVRFEVVDSLFGRKSADYSFTNCTVVVLYRNYSVFVG